MRTVSGDPCLHYDCSNRNICGYCKTTVCINNNYRHEELFETSNRSNPIVAKPQTNADRIRAMTDEELAEWIGKVTAGGYGMCAPGHYDCTGKDSCAPCWLDYLKQEVDE